MTPTDDDARLKDVEAVFDDAGKVFKNTISVRVLREYGFEAIAIARRYKERADKLENQLRSIESSPSLNSPAARREIEALRERAERAEAAKARLNELHINLCMQLETVEEERVAARADLEAYQAVGDLETCQRLKKYYREARAQAEALRGALRRWLDNRELTSDGYGLLIHDSKAALAGAVNPVTTGPDISPAKPASGCNETCHGEPFDSACCEHCKPAAEPPEAPEECYGIRVTINTATSVEGGQLHCPACPSRKGG